MKGCNTVLMAASETEMRAAELVYERDHGHKIEYSEIPIEEREQILREIRTRVLRIEQFVTHEMLDKKLSEGRRTPRRHQLVAFTAMVIIAIFGLCVVGFEELFTYLFHR